MVPKSDAQEAEPAISTHDTIVPRHLAAMFDNIFTIIGGLLLAKTIREDWQILQVLVLLGIVPAYFYLCEGFFGRTLGKLVMGLVVVQYDGSRCTWQQAAIRTLFRFLEVNPLLFGALPAALSIVASRYRQRFGDKVARTIVVLASRLRR